MAYSTGNTGPNFGLAAARSRQWEVGAKWQGTHQQLELAWFDTRSQGEIVPVATVNGRSVFQNVDNVRRRGLEVGWRAKWGAWAPRASYTYLDAHFGSAYAGAGAPTSPRATSCRARRGTLRSLPSTTRPPRAGN